MTMAYPVEYVSGHLFVCKFWGKLTVDNYFHCFCKTCPFSLSMNVDLVAGRKVAVSCRSEPFLIHCHDNVARSKRENKKMIQRQPSFIEKRPQDQQAISFRQNHTFWRLVAKNDSKKFKKHLINIEAVKVYGLNHPKKARRRSTSTVPFR